MVEDVEAQLRVAAIGQRWPESMAIDDGAIARVSVFRRFRGTESERGRGETGGAGRGGRERPYPGARRLGEVGTTRGRRERPRGSLQREVGDDRVHFPNRPLAFYFSFLSGPLPVLFSVY